MNTYAEDVIEHLRKKSVGVTRLINLRDSHGYSKRRALYVINELVAYDCIEKFPFGNVALYKVTHPDDVSLAQAEKAAEADEKKRDEAKSQKAKERKPRDHKPVVDKIIDGDEVSTGASTPLAYAAILNAYPKLEGASGALQALVDIGHEAAPLLAKATVAAIIWRMMERGVIKIDISETRTT
jgi:hypothetical protein